MTRKQQLLVVLAALLAAVASFAVAYAQRSAATSRAAAGNPAGETLLNWLNVPAAAREQILARDPAFGDDLARLRNDLNQRRETLAAALEDPTSAPDVIRARVEAVIAASASLERRVTEYLLSVRDHLTPEQQKRLLSLCAQGVRQGSGWRWRHGQGGDGAGQGPGGGGGPGPRYRGGRGAGG
jgi:Spy/CpxP family protein refolding chaperone